MSQNSGFQYQFWTRTCINPCFETRVPKFGFLSNCWFYSLVLYKSQQWDLSLFLSRKRRFSNTAFQKLYSNPNWYWKSEKKSISNTKKDIFWFTLTGPISRRYFSQIWKNVHWPIKRLVDHEWYSYQCPFNEINFNFIWKVQL